MLCKVTLAFLALCGTGLCGVPLARDLTSTITITVTPPPTYPQAVTVTQTVSEVSVTTTKKTKTVTDRITHSTTIFGPPPAPVTVTKTVSEVVNPITVSVKTTGTTTITKTATFTDPGVTTTAVSSTTTTTTATTTATAAPNPAIDFIAFTAAKCPVDATKNGDAPNFFQTEITYDRATNSSNCVKINGQPSFEWNSIAASDVTPSCELMFYPNADNCDADSRGSYPLSVLSGQGECHNENPVRSVDMVC